MRDMNRGTRGPKSVEAQRPAPAEHNPGPNTSGVQKSIDRESMMPKARTKPMKRRFGKSYF